MLTAIRLAALCLLLCAMSAASAAPSIACVLSGQYKAISLQMGVHVVIVCTDSASAAPYPDGFSCLYSTCNKDTFLSSVLRVATAPDRQKAIDAEWEAHIKWTCDAPPNDRAQALCVERKAWIAANWPAWTGAQP